MRPSAGKNTVVASTQSHCGVGSVAAVAAMAATLFWQKKNKKNDVSRGPVTGRCMQG